MIAQDAKQLDTSIWMSSQATITILGEIIHISISFMQLTLNLIMFSPQLLNAQILI